MNATSAAAATALVAVYLQRRTPPREALARDGRFRGLPAAARAAAARLANAVIGQWRWLAFELGWPERGAVLPEPGEAAALVDAVLRPVPSRRAAAQARCAGLADPVHRLAVRHALPDALAARFLGDYGSAADTVLAALAEPAPRTLRANLLRVADREALAAELAAAGVETAPTRHSPWGLVVLGDADLFAMGAYRRGAFEQQDEASQLAALAVAPPPRGRVLDLCAGNGGKTLALCAQLGNRGEVLATDVSAPRLAALRERAARAGVANLRTVQIGADAVPEDVVAFARRADRILIDAPCTGSGSWRRRPEARWQVDAGGVAELLATQQRLLQRAAGWLGPGARLVYATCSLFGDENETQVAALLGMTAGLERVRLAEVLGGAAAAEVADASGTILTLRPDRHGCDGFYAAILRRPRR